jgi:hypothetical protein
MYLCKYVGTYGMMSAHVSMNFPLYNEPPGGQKYATASQS